MEVIKQLKNKVKEYRKSEMYTECIETCHKALKILKTKEITNAIKSEISYFYYMIGKSYKGLNKINKAILYTKKALRFVNNELDKIYQYWLLSICYELTEKDIYINKAIVLNNKCIEYFSKKLDFAEDSTCVTYLTSILSNQSVLLSDINLANDALNMYIEECKNDIDRETLDGMYINFFKIYRNKRNYIEAQKTCYKIHDENIRKKLLNTLENKMLVAI